jgi:hypothetical protein
LEDEDGWFNATKLVKIYQPENKNIKGYLDQKKFAKLFDIRCVELDQIKGHNTFLITSLSHENAVKMSYNISKGPNEYRGVYYPHDYLHVILMILDPNYRYEANKVFDAIADVQRETEEDAHVTVTSKDVKKEIDVEALQYENEGLREQVADLQSKISPALIFPLNLIYFVIQVGMIKGCYAYLYFNMLYTST